MGSHSYYDYEGGKPGCLWIIMALAFGCLFFIFASCSPTKRIGGMAAKHPNEARKVCVSMFPPEIKTVTNTEYIHGKARFDTVVVTANCDTVIKWIDGKPLHVIRKVSVPCPPSIHKTDTIVKTEVRTIENKAKIDVLTADLAKSKAEAERAKQGRTTWRYIALAALAVLLGVSVLKFFTGRAAKLKDKLS